MGTATPMEESLQIAPVAVVPGVRGACVAAAAISGSSARLPAGAYATRIGIRGITAVAVAGRIGIGRRVAVGVGIPIGIGLRCV